MTEDLLTVQNLQVQFPAQRDPIKAVDNVSFTLKPGQTLGIVGESGSGKSVTALSILRLIPTPGQIIGGEIWLQDTALTASSQPVNLLSLPEKEMRHYRGGRISMVFQEPMSSLNPVFTCGFQLIEALRLHQPLSAAAAQRQAISLLQEVQLIPSNEILQSQLLKEADDNGIILTERELLTQLRTRQQSFLERYPHELSGGQIQRVMIAMAISSNPALLIADEPTTALDVTVQARILDLLKSLRAQRGMSLIFVTHDLGIISDIADVVAVMYQGRIVEYGPAEQVFTQPHHPYTQGLLACRPQPHRRLQYLPIVADFMQMGLNEQGHAVLQAKATPLPSIKEITLADQEARLNTLAQQSPLMAVENLEVLFPVRGVFGQTQRYVTAVNKASFVIYPGETLGLVGESGCGKTTLGRALVRLIEPNGGSIRFQGQEIVRLQGKALRHLRQNLQIIFQDPFSALNPRMKIADIVMEPMQIFARSGGTKRNARERAVYLLERVGLQPSDMRRYPHEFSGGQRQRICIARALALNPKLVICDEAVSALDLLKELQQDFALTYLFISHDLSVVKFMSDRVMVMNQGTIEEIGSADTIYTQPQQRYTQQLIAAIPTANRSRTVSNLYGSEG
jgi:peptide/nickel transport system ATP-binding protein